MIDTPNIEEAKKLIVKERKPIIIKAKGDKFNRKILEYGKFDILLSIEAGRKKDSLKNLDSGLNEISARIAAKNNIAIGIDLNAIKNLDKKEKAGRLGRIIQNIRICRKAGAKIRIINKINTNNSFCLLLSLGASTWQAKEAIQQNLEFP